ASIPNGLLENYTSKPSEKLPLFFKSSKSMSLPKYINIKF
ncbi:3431_t:CDS:1, partial [Funneliformis mosseae]